MSIVVDINDPDYCEMKAIESIHEARKNTGTAHYNSMIAQAMSLLALARIQRGPVQAKGE